MIDIHPENSEYSLFVNGRLKSALTFLYDDISNSVGGKDEVVSNLQKSIPEEFVEVLIELELWNRKNSYTTLLAPTYIKESELKERFKRISDETRNILNDKTLKIIPSFHVAYFMKK